MLSTVLLALLLVPLASAQDTAELRRLARDAGIIFSGTVQKIEAVASAARGDIGLVRITFRVEKALRGATAGEPLSVSEWDGLWTSGDRYRVGEDLLLFLYPPSGELGLTTPVGGEQGRIRAADSQLSIAALARQIGAEPVPLPARRKPRLKLHRKLWFPARVRLQE